MKRAYIFPCYNVFVCVLASLFLGIVLFGCTKRTATPFKNVVLIIVDTLAVEHLGAYNEKVTASPNIDALAKSGVLFERTYSPASWTKPAVSSVFTGVMPSVHGVKSINDLLPDKFQTFAELLKQRGFQTGGFVSHTLISPSLGYAQGFDRYDTIPFKGNVHDVISSEKVTDMGLSWLREAVSKTETPFFLFLHYFDPHNNYKHHQAFDRTSWYKGSLKPGMDIRALRAMIPTLGADDIRYLRGLYEEEIAFTDHEIGRFMATLKALGLADETLVVLTADHGEEFLDHGGIGHSRTLYDELIRVPLIFSLPGKIKPSRISESVTTLDIMPTVLDSLGFGKEEIFSGTSLKRALFEGIPPSSRDIFSEVDFRSSAIKAYKISVVRGSEKLILDKPSRTFELYNLLIDPKEKNNLISQDTKKAALLSPLLFSYEQSQKSHFAGEVKEDPERSPEEIEQLKSLGYL